MFIVFEGLDNCGKSTQAELLRQHFQEKGLRVHLCREPGTTSLGSKVRHLLLNDEEIKVCQESEILLFFAARAQLHNEIINPALAAGDVVILDRWSYSTAAYQNFMGTEFETMTDFVSKGQWPERVFYLDIDIQTMMNRHHGPLDKFERRGGHFYLDTKKRYEQLADYYGFITIDGKAAVEVVSERIKRHVQR